ncbi:Bro-a [Artaxa digramma nucleopolyhedrovirus]|uniref:Bro-a n=1 Tax=Artaxa digramma nucleopolyhedrovirus TaxID=3070910 RepID=A0AAE6UZR5_9ABAC|nr:Bro-a [Euproctis digramma nucleopolyhedrovirus]QHB21697.1 Bro-a [Artaxa digramma nucleopolyhedrovirus]
MHKNNKHFDDNLDVLYTVIKNQDDAINLKNVQISKLIMAIIDANNQCVALSARLADVVDDVVVKPRDHKLLHALVVCELSRNRFAFLRTQLRSLKRSIKKLGLSENIEPVVIYKNDYVPNSINVFNKLKEHLPANKFTAKNNKIQLVNKNDRKLLVDTLVGIVKR